MSAIDITGHVYGRLTVVVREGTRGESALWRCICECGTEKVATSNLLRTGGATSCGCARRGADLTGRRFGSFVILGLGSPGKSREVRWSCRCDCGEVRPIVTSKIKHQTKCNRCVATTHGHSRGGKNSSTYTIWSSMVKRCTNERCKSWPDYGGRGIRVCDRWLKFENFLADMGVRPDGLSIDRIEVNGNYELGNCRWATRKEQARNTRATKLEPHEAAQIRWLITEKQTLTSIANFFGITITTVSRIRDGKSWA